MAILKIIIELWCWDGKKQLHAVYNEKKHPMEVNEEEKVFLLSKKKKIISIHPSRADDTCLWSAAPQPQQGKRPWKGLRALQEAGIANWTWKIEANSLQVLGLQCLLVPYAVLHPVPRAKSHPSHFATMTQSLLQKSPSAQRPWSRINWFLKPMAPFKNGHRAPNDSSVPVKKFTRINARAECI